MTFDEAAARLRRMMGPYASRWTDDELTDILTAHAYTPPVGASETVYDVHGAAASLWLEIANDYVGAFDASVDGTNARRSQKYEHAMRMYAAHNAQRLARVVAVTTREDVATPDIGVGDDASH